MKLSIIVPAHNEFRRIDACMFTLCAYLNSQPYDSEVIVVENGSTDTTYSKALWWEEEFLNKPTIKVFQLPQASKAKAVQYGVLMASGDYLYMADVDLSTPIREVETFLHHAQGGADVVIGSRSMRGAQVTQSFRRTLMGRIFNVLTSIVLPRVPDTQCGFKMFTRSAGQNCFANLEITSMAFDVAVLVEARRRGYSIVQIPVTWKENYDSRVRVFRDSIQMAADVLRLAIQKYSHGGHYATKENKKDLEAAQA
jgi:dolichyl-phosphate beta-glucosyltransferase